MRFKIPARQPRGFTGTAKYLAGHTKGQSPDRVEWCIAHNMMTTDPEAAAAIMGATAARSVRCQQPVYHFVITFDPKDRAAGKIGPEKMQEIAAQVLERMGLKDYQGLIYAHRDTKHPHMHFLVNRVHPETGKAYSRHNDGRRLTEICREIARERGLNIPRDLAREQEKTRVDNFTHLPAPKEGDYWQARKEQAVPDKPYTKAQIRTLRQDLREVFHQAPGWEALDKALQAKGLRLAPKGQGLVLTDGERVAKLSDMGKGIRLPELEKRFGERFADFADRQAEERLKEHEPPALPPGTPPQEVEKRKRQHRLHQLMEQDKIHPAILLDTADVDYRFWSGIEQQYQYRQRGVASRGRQLSRLEGWEQRQAEKTKEKAHSFTAALEKVFQDGKATGTAWERLEKQHGFEITAALVRQHPMLLGQMRGTNILGIKTKARKEAERAFRHLATKRKGYLTAKQRLEFVRGQVKEARRLMDITWRDYQAMQRSAGTPERVRAMVIEKIKTRARALDRVSGRMIDASSFTKDRKEQLQKALAKHQKRRRNRERELHNDVGRHRN